MILLDDETFDDSADRWVVLGFIWRGLGHDDRHLRDRCARRIFNFGLSYKDRRTMRGVRQFWCA